MKKLLLSILLFSAGITFAECVAMEDPETLGQLLCNIKMNTFQGIFKLIFVFAYVSGMGLMVAAIFKLKQVKENPTQIPVSTPMALFMCAALLLYLPEVIIPAGESIFGAGANESVADLRDAANDPSSIGVPTITNLME